MTGHTIAFGALLVVAAAIDLLTWRLPDWITVGGAAAGVFLAESAALALGGAFTGYALGYGVGHAVLERGGRFGGGDVKLLMMAGAWLTPVGVVQLGILCALPFAFVWRRGWSGPAGPVIAAAAIAAYVV